MNLEQILKFKKLGGLLKNLSREDLKQYRTWQHNEWLKTPAGKKYMVDLLASQKEKRKLNPEPIRAMERRRSQIKRQDPEYRERESARTTAAQRRTRTSVLLEYGGMCECCNEAHLEFLCIDHTHTGGIHHRALMKRASIYTYLKEAGFPKDGFRVLCMNCNSSLGYRGYCPHRRESKCIQKL